MSDVRAGRRWRSCSATCEPAASTGSSSSATWEFAGARGAGLGPLHLDLPLGDVPLPAGRGSRRRLAPYWRGWRAFSAETAAGRRQYLLMLRIGAADRHPQRRRAGDLRPGGRADRSHRRDRARAAIRSPSTSPACRSWCRSASPAPRPPGWGTPSAVATSPGRGGRRRPACCSGPGTMACFALLFATLPGPLGHLYTQDPAVIAVVVALLPIAAVFQVFDGLQVVARRRAPRRRGHHLPRRHGIDRLLGDRPARGLGPRLPRRPRRPRPLVGVRGRPDDRGDPAPAAHRRPLPRPPRARAAARSNASTQKEGKGTRDELQGPLLRPRGRLRLVPPRLPARRCSTSSTSLARRPRRSPGTAPPATARPPWTSPSASSG